MSMLMSCGWLTNEWRVLLNCERCKIYDSRSIVYKKNRGFELNTITTKFNTPYSVLNTLSHKLKRARVYFKTDIKHCQSFIAIAGNAGSMSGMLRIT